MGRITALADTGLDALRDSVFFELRAVMNPANLQGAVRCAHRLHSLLREPRQLGQNVVLVAYGGGKDSSYTIAFARAVQLLLFRIYGATFKLRVVTNRHAGMPWAVMENIDRTYGVLRIHEDPDCEALMVDGNEIKPFQRDEPLPPEVIERNRLDILMSGHRTHAEARPTFCNACNLSMVNAFGLAASHLNGVQVIITGDSPQEQRAYALWVNRLALRSGARLGRQREAGVRAFLKTTDDISRAYFSEIHGSESSGPLNERRVAYDVPDDLQFFSIYEDTEYSAGEHWRLLTDYLGFQFDELAFSFTESDCANPTLMAHLRALKCERLYGRSYRDGLSEYVQFATSLMRRKEFPEHLIERMVSRYDGRAAADRMRAAANHYARQVFNLTEEHLVCMIHAPFTGEGEHLERFVRFEQPHLAGRLAEVHALLAGAETTCGPAANSTCIALESMSGLTLAQIRSLYRSPLRPIVADRRSPSLINAILAGDPHKDVIRTRHAADGPVVTELLSGR